MLPKVPFHPRPRPAYHAPMTLGNLEPFGGSTPEGGKPPPPKAVKYSQPLAGAIICRAGGRQNYQDHIRHGARARCRCAIDPNAGGKQLPKAQHFPPAPASTTEQGLVADQQCLAGLTAEQAVHGAS